MRPRVFPAEDDDGEIIFNFSQNASMRPRVFPRRNTRPGPSLPCFTRYPQFL